MMKEMAEILIEGVSYSFDPETEYMKDGHAYCKTCHERKDGEVKSLMDMKFVDNPKKIIKIIGANDDDLKILITKGFVIVFERGIIVITHWKINNYIRSDRRKETMYITEKQSLTQTENGAYIKLEKLGIPNDNQVSAVKIYQEYRKDISRPLCNYP